MVFSHPILYLYDCSVIKDFFYITGMVEPCRHQFVIIGSENRPLLKSVSL